MRMPDAAADVNARCDPAEDVSASPCRNCGAPASGNFCAHCGQETALALPTFRSFMREAAGRYVALDGRLWRTLFALAARPGYLTLEYFAGRRRRYIRPARLFLVFYLLLFAVIGLVQSPADLGDEIVFVQSDGATQSHPPGSQATTVPAPEAPKPADDTRVGLDKDLNLTLRVGGADLALPVPLRRRYEQFKALSKDQKAERLYAGALRYGPYAMVALLPAFAWLQMLVYLGRARPYPARPRRYAQHLVYSAHLHAFAAMVFIVMLALPYPALRTALLLWLIVYVLRARHVVYGGRWWAGLLRTTVVAVCYSVLISLAMLGLLAAAVMLR